MFFLNRRLPIQLFPKSDPEVALTFMKRSFQAYEEMVTQSAEETTPVEPEIYRDLIDSFIESSENPRKQKMLLTMIVMHYKEKDALKMLPGLTSWQYQEVWQ